MVIHIGTSTTSTLYMIYLSVKMVYIVFIKMIFVFGVLPSLGFSEKNTCISMDFPGSLHRWDR